MPYGMHAQGSRRFRDTGRASRAGRFGPVVSAAPKAEAAPPAPADGSGAAHYEAIFRSAVDYAIIAIDRRGRITAWNPGAERLLGWSAVEMLGQDAAIFFTPEDRASGRVDTEMSCAVRDGHANDERWHLRRDGSRLWASGEMMPLLDAEGALLGFLKIMRDRTQQREAAEKQRSDVEFLNSILASSADCIKVLDLDGRVVFMNDGGQRVMEVADFEAIRGCQWTDFWPGRHHADAQSALQAAQAGLVGQFQGAANTMAGTPKYWDVQVTPILGAAGKPEKLLSVSRDMTGAHHAEQALRDAEGLNTPILNSSRDCIVVLDLEGRTVFVSPGGIEAMEIADVQSILGLSWLRVWKGADHDAASHAVAMARAGGMGRFQGFCATHKGTPKWWDVAISPIPGRDGRPERLVSVGRDITGQKALERDLRHINATLEQRVEERTADRNRLWQLSADIMLVARFDGTIVATNPAWQAVLGWAESELAGTNFLDLFHPEDRAQAEDAASRLNDGSTFEKFEGKCRHRDGGTRWIDWSAVPGGGLINAVGRDVSREREKAEMLRRAEDALRQSQKMEAVGQLTGGLAHDFNNLLTGITGSLELLQNRVAQGRLADADRYINAAQGAARRAAALTHRLLAFSRRQTLDPKSTSINRLAAGMEELIRRTVGPEIELEVITAAGLWSTLVDPGQLENALLNLCINARDAMPGGGKLTIETGNRKLDARAAGERDLPPGHYVTLCVSDNGTGMTPDIIARAFEPFYTTKPLGQGTGLGLSMIYGFARQSGGHARIYSEPGQGTMVCLYLPRHFGALDDSASPDEPHAAPRAAAGETVLVVDDDPTVRMLVTEVLEELGYTAIEAPDGVAGLRILQSDIRIDLLVTDVGLPGGLNGRQMADGARVSRPLMKVLFITGYAENAVLSHGHLEAGMHVLTKPFAMDALATRIRQVIEG